MKHCVVPLANVRKASITEPLQGYFTTVKRETLLKLQNKVLNQPRFLTQQRVSQSGSQATIICCLPLKEQQTVKVWQDCKLPLSRTGAPAGCLYVPLEAGGGPLGGPEAVPGAVHDTVNYSRLPPRPSRKRSGLSQPQNSLHFKSTWRPLRVWPTHNAMRDPRNTETHSGH